MTHPMSEWFLLGLIALLWVVQGLGQVRDVLMRQMLLDLEARVKRLEAERTPWESPDAEGDHW